LFSQATKLQTIVKKGNNRPDLLSEGLADVDAQISQVGLKLVKHMADSCLL